MEIKAEKQRMLTTCLLIAYLILLTWIILFKMQFVMQDFARFRRVNLIPLGGSAIVNGKLDLSEIFKNVMAFAPFGVYTSMLKSNWPFFKKVAAIATVSLSYEVVQFLLAIGASDMTDLLANTLGGVVGIAGHLLLRRWFKTDYRTNRILNAVALTATIGIIALLAILLVSNT